MPIRPASQLCDRRPISRTFGGAQISTRGGCGRRNNREDARFLLSKWGRKGRRCWTILHCLKPLARVYGWNGSKLQPGKSDGFSRMHRSALSYRQWKTGFSCLMFLHCRLFKVKIATHSKEPMCLQCSSEHFWQDPNKKKLIAKCWSHRCSLTR